MSDTTVLTALVSENVKDALQNDLVSMGELRRIIEGAGIEKIEVNDYLEYVIRHLLADDVEIGNAQNIEGKHVKFLAWKGSISDRYERARREMKICKKRVGDFAFWLCLRSNVDEYEML